MKKIDVNFLEPSKQQLNDLLELYQAGRYEDAEKLSLSITQEFPKHQFAWKVLGAALKQIGKINESLVATQKSVQLNPQDAEVYYNLGNTLKELGRLEEAEVSYRQVITLKPDYAKAHNNLGVMLQELGRLDEAEISYRQAITLKPDYAEAWNNIFFSLQAIKLQSSSLEDRIPLFDEQTNSKYVQILKSILNYRLNLGNPSTDKSFKDVLNILSSTDNTFIKNPEVSSNELIKPTLPEKITALVHFGRSGTGLMHSLIDAHPEVSTLPSIYFSEFFDHLTWEKIIAGGWEEMADRFTTIYDVLFDASSNIKIPSKGNRYISNIGQKEGMTTVGEEKNEVLSVDKKAFIKELKKLMDYHNHLDQFTFFKLIHTAYEKVLNSHNKKNHIFYHIHNPDTYAWLNFLRLAPNTNWLMMVREPIQSCESWIRDKFNDNDYNNIAHKIFQMLFEVDNIILRDKHAIGIRLEDLKEYPKKTISALCDWLDIKENDSLYEMTAQGKKWWGDPSSPDYTKEAMSPFGKISTKHKLGSIFSENDQYILSTLFYPFSVRFNYVEENLEKFKNDLQTIRPMLDQMFGFERKIVQNKKMNTESFMQSGSYLYLRSGMIERWNTLNTLHTYPNMLTLLKIN